jgi:hypothetical protein
MPSERPRVRRPLVVRTSGNATERVYGLVLATSVIAVSAQYDQAHAGRVAVAVLVTALVFWIAHAYAAALGVAVSEDEAAMHVTVVRALREHWSLVEVTIPVLLALGLGVAGLVPDRAALVVATVVALLELAGTGAYGARRQGAGAHRIAASATIALVLGLLIVVLKAFVH